MKTTIAMIKAANQAAGQHYFERSTMKFFKSRILPTVYGGKYFVTGETGPHGSEKFTVREAIDGGANIKTIGEFNRMTLDEAQDLAKAMTKSDQGAKAINQAVPSC